MKKTKCLKILLGLSLLTSPILVEAQGSLAQSTFGEIIMDQIIPAIGLLFPILIALAFILFVWGLAKFMLNSGNKTEREKGKSWLLWGIITFFALLSLRGIIGLILASVGFGSSSTSEYSILLPE